VLTDSLEAVSLDNSQYLRRAVHIPAKLIAAEDAPQCDCVVLDISENGARIGIEAARGMPDEFTVVFTPRGSPYRRCRVVWRADTQVGVEFDKAVTSHAGANASHVARV
jgi:hypothetical protein